MPDQAQGKHNKPEETAPLPACAAKAGNPPASKWRPLLPFAAWGLGVIQGRRLSYIFMLLILTGTAPLAAEDETISCGKEASSEAALEKRGPSLLSLEKVREWERHLPKGVHMTTIPGKADIKHDEECYREFSLYEMHSDHMTLWHAFLVGERGILVENLDSDWVPVNLYEKW